MFKISNPVPLSIKKNLTSECAFTEDLMEYVFTEELFEFFWGHTENQYEIGWKLILSEQKWYN